MTNIYPNPFPITDHGEQPDSESLKASLTAMEEIAQMGSYEAEAATMKLSFSSGFYKLFGEEPFSFEPSQEFINSRSDPNDTEKVKKVIEEAAINKQPYYYTRRIKRKDGKWRILESHGKVICNDAGEVVKFYGVVQDITEKQVAKRQLNKNRNLLQSIIDTTLIGMSVLEAVRGNEGEIIDFKILLVNKELERMTGRTDLVGRHYAEEYPGIKQIGLFDLMLEVMETGEPGRMEYKYEHEGFKKWFMSMFVKLNDGLVATNLDITETKQAEEEKYKNFVLLKQSEQIAQMGSWSYDPENGELSWSEGMYNLFKLQQNSRVSPEIYLDFILPEERAELQNLLIEKIRAVAGDFDEELSFTIEGKRKLIQIKATPIADSTGKVVKMVGVDADITQKRTAEEKQQENEFMKILLEKKDEFMSVASHELKTPITTVKASLQILCRLIEKHSDENVLLVFAKKANLQINKVIGLISDLMDNAKIQAGKINLNIDRFSLNEVIDECIAFQDSAHKINVISNLTEEIEGDRNRIEQVITNFISNAIKYSPQGKQIDIRATRHGGLAKIEITDFGIGIPEAKINHVFDRFFRVDDKSQQFSGLGLGLYISSEIIKRHGGTYGVISELGKGSTFWFTIPVKYGK